MQVVVGVDRDEMAVDGKVGFAGDLDVPMHESVEWRALRRGEGEVRASLGEDVRPLVAIEAHVGADVADECLGGPVVDG